ncbi:HesA/MoeB/ThiF family protein [Arthrobacter sp. NPDC056691]|uniref:HesA/MoeB/ThiF family protein n=1 Tax=Arthrobacter sp. NPDC056691 TaxID=3345913 RepID=UPI00366D6180
MKRPQLKSVPVVKTDTGVLVYRRAHERVELEDPDGSISQLLHLLTDGRPITQVAARMQEQGFSWSADDVVAAVEVLNGLALVHEAGTRDSLPRPVQTRQASNLHFFDLFSDLDRSAADFQRDIAASHVLLLGAGGAGSGILQALVGAGVGSIRIVDEDTVEEKNLARQFCYGEHSIGLPKVDAATEWARAYSHSTCVEGINQRITTVHQILKLAAGTDIVILAIDSPSDIQLLVNAACQELGVPFVTGGLQQSTLFYWSVDPGGSACRMCLELHRQANLEGRDHPLQSRLVFQPDLVNRGTGPVAQILSGLMSLEALRYISQYELPVAAATYHWISLAESMSVHSERWTNHPACPYCPRAAVLSAPMGTP